MILNVCALKWCKNYGNITFCLGDTAIFFTYLLGNHSVDNIQSTEAH